MPHAGTSVFGKKPLVCPPREKRPLYLIRDLFNDTKNELTGVEAQLRTKMKKGRAELEVYCQELREGMDSLTTEIRQAKAELARSRQHAVEQARRREELSAQRLQNGTPTQLGNANEVKSKFGVKLHPLNPFAASRPPTIRCAAIKSSTAAVQTTAAKRKATDELDQAPKRQKPESSAPFASASSQLKSLGDANAATNRRMVPHSQREAMQTGGDVLRPQQSRVTKSGTAPRASRYPNNPKFDAAVIEATTEATAGAVSPTTNQAAHCQGKENEISPTQASSLSTETNDRPGSEKPTNKPSTGQKGGNADPQTKGSNSRIPNASNLANGAVDGKGAAAGKKRKEMSKSTSGGESAGDASARAKATGSRRSTRSTRRVEHSKADAAPPKNKKRRASDDDDNVRDSKKQKTSKKGTKFPGLRNWSNACFSNVVLQLLDAGLGGQDIDALLSDVKDFNPFRAANATELSDMVKNAAAAGETEKFSAVEHFRKVFADMHTQYSENTKRTVDPTAFQLVVAYGVIEDATHNAMDGDTQQDAFEYYQLLLNALLKDPDLANEEALRAQFEVETEVRDVCTPCDYKSKPRTAINNYYGVDVPDEHDPEVDTFDFEFDSMLGRSLYNVSDRPCKHCGNMLETQTEFTKLPENFVIKLNRTGFANEEASKIATPVKFGHTIYPRKKVPYELSAVVMHKGPRITAGHYSMYRKEGHEWYLLDDDKSVVVAKPVADSAGDDRHSAMMLYKKASVGN